MRKIKGISYDTNKDSYLINHIEKQQNQSKYILELVRKDMESKNIEILIEKKIKEIIGNIDLTVDKVESKLDKFDTSGIGDILNIK